MSISPKQKVYQGILHELRKYIDEHALKPGDKLPSERELSEKLEAGRSSIREALRAMELLGLIETRHGEGTFLSQYRPFHSVEVLSSFIMQGANTRNDLLFAKKIIEKEAARIAYSHIDNADIENLKEIIHDTALSNDEKHVAFFQYLFYKTDNLLFAKVWQLMDEFSYTISSLSYDQSFYQQLVKLYENNNFKNIEDLFYGLPAAGK
ncbi:FadR/GntR family transcriptional regulator [Lentibacillus amyloliquefaciens]|uniref:GntR family transcriptional regulator n=1 Tax=Lentibacillus amyloliquefaciens TaxID=1472767 RepID=A0A0U4FD12_9BACI|nr:GntR family transcriptional regulator [Lentibacillus amyloliquefaciens]ALX48349.1 GntR family transcriptional regulator [Lentibacillus amyloliquefaciens]